MVRALPITFFPGKLVAVHTPDAWRDIPTPKKLSLGFASKIALWFVSFKILLQTGDCKFFEQTWDNEFLST